MMTKPLLGLLGILIAAITAELNDVVTSIALVDVRGAFGISYDPGTWIQSLYVSAEIVGMAVSPWQLVTFTLRRWTLFSIALCALSSVLIPFSPNIESVYALRLLQGLSEGLIIPLLMTTALRALTPQNRLYGLAVYALSSTFTPALATTLAALWTDVVVDWRFAFFQAVPLCTLAGVLVWYGATRRMSRITSASTCSTGEASFFSPSDLAPSVPCYIKVIGWIGSTRH
jgi:MFS transporter, DHA2 family, multidrug resistance protein